MLDMNKIISLILLSFVALFTSGIESKSSFSIENSGAGIDTSNSVAPVPDYDVRTEAAMTLYAPVGGYGGEPWDDSVNINGTTPEEQAKIKFTPHRRISEIRASCGDRPDSLQFIYRDNYDKVGVASAITKPGDVHGTVAKKETQRKVFKIDTDEMITGVWLETCQVRHGLSKRHRICFIRIETTKKTGDMAFKCGDSTWKPPKGKFEKIYTAKSRVPR